MQGRRKLRGSCGSGVDMTFALLQAGGRRLRRVVAPAVVVALAVVRLGQPGELFRERALAERRAVVGERVAGILEREQAVLPEALEVRRERVRRHREEARELR